MDWVVVVDDDVVRLERQTRHRDDDAVIVVVEVALHLGMGRGPGCAGLPPPCAVGRPVDPRGRIFSRRARVVVIDGQPLQLVVALLGRDVDPAGGRSGHVAEGAVCRNCLLVRAKVDGQYLRRADGECR